MLVLEWTQCVRVGIGRWSVDVEKPYMSYPYSMVGLNVITLTTETQLDSFFLLLFQEKEYCS